MSNCIISYSSSKIVHLFHIALFVVLDLSHCVNIVISTLKFILIIIFNTILYLLLFVQELHSKEPGWFNIYPQQEYV